MQNYTLKNGVEIPRIGFGTWKLNTRELAYPSVKEAIKAGYTHIDTAAVYANEEFVGEAIRDANVDRESLFITTKLWNDVRGYDETLDAFNTSLEKLGVDYIDLYLIHWPNPVKYRDNWQAMNAASWKAMEYLYKEGKVRAIGVSNFLPHHLQELEKTMEIAPMVNQIELHPGQLHKETVAYCREHEILIEAWSPLASGDLIQKKEIVELAAKYGKNVGQLLLRWHIQHNFLPLPRSTNPERIASNLDVFDFDITTEDMNYIDALPYEDTNSNTDPDTANF